MKNLMNFIRKNRLAFIILLILSSSVYAKFCEHCDLTIPDTSYSCDFCGWNAENESALIICPYCKTKISMNADFCKNCGILINENADSHFKTGLVYYQNEDYNLALTEFQKTISEIKYYLPAHLFYLMSQGKQHNLETAMSEYENSGTGNSGTGSSGTADKYIAKFALGVANFLIKNYTTAVYLWNECLDNYPQKSEILYLLGSLQQERGASKRDVMVFYLKSINARKSFWLPSLAIASIYFDDGRYDSAYKYLLDALKYNSKDSKVLFLLAKTKYQTEGSVTKVVNSYYRSALEIKKNFSEVYLELGRMAFRENRYNSALDNFDKASQSSEDLEIMLLCDYYLGNINDRIKNFDLLNINKQDGSDHYVKFISEYEILGGNYSISTAEEIARFTGLYQLLKENETGSLSSKDYRAKRRELLLN